MNSELLGRAQSSFAYADYGVPDQQTGHIGTRSEFLDDYPKTVAAFMEATRKGYAWAVDHRDEAAGILIAAGDFPNPELVQGSVKKIVEDDFLHDDDTPVGRIDPDRFAAMAKLLFDSGVLRDTTMRHFLGRATSRAGSIRAGGPNDAERGPRSGIILPIS